MDIDIPQARRLADLISASVSHLGDISSSAEKGRGQTGQAIHVQTIVSAATQLAALVRPPAQVLLEVATGFTLSAALRLVVEANVPEIIRSLTDSHSAISSDNAGNGTSADDSGIELLEKYGDGAADGAGGVGVPVSETSHLCGIEVGKLERILRLLATHHIFVEYPPICSENIAAGGAGEQGETGEARFANNRLSEALDSGAALKDILAHTSAPSSPMLTIGCEDGELRNKQQRWAAKYGAEAPGAGLAALVGILTDESMFHMTALTDVLLSSHSQSNPPTSSHTIRDKDHEGGDLETPNEAPPEEDPDSPYLAAFSFARSLPRTTMFEWLGQLENAHRLHRFGCAMKGMNALESEGAILKGFDFSSLPSNSVIIDVGGGVGAASLPILRANEHLRLVVQDTGEVVRVAPSFWEKHYPEALRSGRVKFAVQDFFEEQPNPRTCFSKPDSDLEKGTGESPPVYIYLLRMIAHNWGDTHCLRILRRLREAAAAASRGGEGGGGEKGGGSTLEEGNKKGNDNVKLILVDSVLMPACRSHVRDVDLNNTDEESGSLNRKRKRSEDIETDMNANTNTDGTAMMGEKVFREAPEPLLPNWGVANALAYRLDLIMLANHNALERTLPHFQSLLARAGWEVVDVHTHIQGDGSEGGGGAGESWMPQIVAVPV